MDWPLGKSEALRRMWLDGGTSGQIATALGVTRNAVLGRVRRMGLMGRADRVVVPKTRVDKKVQRIPHESHLWALDDDARRAAFARKAAQGAHEALESVGP